MNPSRTRPSDENEGVIVGRDGALVVDAGINGAVSEQTQQIVATLTDKPIRFLVNTTYHGDHSFGNYAFPADVVIVSSRLNYESMADLDVEKSFRRPNLHGNDHAVDDVVDWRRPGIVFDEYAEIHLGDRTVELHQFGPGNGAGDVVVYEPMSKTAWTGNFLPRAGVAPMLLEGGPGPYIESLEKMRETIDVATVVCGHGPMGDGKDAIDTMIGYLQQLEESVSKALRDGDELEHAVDANTLPERFVSPDLPSPAAETLGRLNGHLHRLNVVATTRRTQIVAQCIDKNSGLRTINSRSALEFAATELDTASRPCALARRQPHR